MGGRVPEPIASIVCQKNMAGIIPHHDQKNRIFSKRERALIHAIKNGLPGEKIAAAAEQLREAKMAVFKCRFALSTVREPHTFSAEELAKSDKQLRKWISMQTTDIIEMYRTNGKPTAAVEPQPPNPDAPSESN